MLAARAGAERLNIMHAASAAEAARRAKIFRFIGVPPLRKLLRGGMHYGTLIISHFTGFWKQTCVNRPKSSVKSMICAGSVAVVRPAGTAKPPGRPSSAGGLFAVLLLGECLIPHFDHLELRGPAFGLKAGPLAPPVLPCSPPPGVSPVSAGGVRKTREGGGVWGGLGCLRCSTPPGRAGRGLRDGCAPRAGGRSG